MHCLNDLKDLFQEHGYKVKDFNGHSLVVGKNRYGMILDQIYINGELADKKKIVREIKDKKRR
jgi:hypothetical protein